MKTIELIKQAEELLGKCSEGPWHIEAGEFVHFLPEQFFNVVTDKKDDNGDAELITSNRTRLENCELIVFARNHMQELVDRLKKYEAALEFYANENNTVRLCVVDEKLCANVDLCEKAKQALLVTQDDVSNPDEPNIFIEHKL